MVGVCCSASNSQLLGTCVVTIDCSYQLFDLPLDLKFKWNRFLNSGDGLGPASLEMGWCNVPIMWCLFLPADASVHLCCPSVIV